MLRRSEFASLVRVQIDVIAEHLEPGDRYHWNRGTNLAGATADIRRPPELLERTEMHDNAHGVCLESDEWKRGANRVAEPEPERNCQTECPRCIDGGRWINIPVADHVIVALSLVFGNCEFAPDIVPFTGVLVDFLFTDFHADIVNESVADVVDPVVCDVGIRLRQRWQVDFDEEGGEEIGVAGNERRDTPPEIAVAVEVDRNRFDGERRIASIDVFEECELGITR